MNYEKKYLKYKQKYLDLKSQLQGGVNVNPWRYTKVTPKDADSEDLKKHLNDKNTIIDEINTKKAEIKKEEGEIKALENLERQEHKKKQADEKLEALKAKTIGGFFGFNASIPESEELKGKKESLKTLKAALADLEKKLDEINKLIEAQKKSDHYAEKINKVKSTPLSSTPPQ
jgi:DNA repair exonuclease SbcCD ATPase subunit